MNVKLVMVDYVSNLSPCSTWRVEAQGSRLAWTTWTQPQKQNSKKKKKAKYVKFSTITNLSF